MAVFYHPTRGAPTTTLTIAFLEFTPKSRPEDKFQSRRLTPGGAAVVDDLGVSEQFLGINIRNLTPANRTSLLNFIKTTVDWASDTFDFDDDGGNQFNTVRFWFDTMDFQRRISGVELYNEEILLRVDV
jgi:hypothetical protein